MQITVKTDKGIVVTYNTKYFSKPPVVGLKGYIISFEAKEDK